MNSLIISQILKYYNHSPYYILNDYISINDDRMGRIVSFKIYEEKGEILVDFMEGYKYYPYITSRYRTTNITSLEKWKYYYNFN
jgi:hypothetical protein